MCHKILKKQAEKEAYLESRCRAQSSKLACIALDGLRWTLLCIEQYTKRWQCKASNADMHASVQHMSSKLNQNQHRQSDATQNLS